MSTTYTHRCVAADSRRVTYTGTSEATCRAYREECGCEHTWIIVPIASIASILDAVRSQVHDAMLAACRGAGAYAPAWSTLDGGPTMTYWPLEAPGQEGGAA